MEQGNLFDVQPQDVGSQPKTTRQKPQSKPKNDTPKAVPDTRKHAYDLMSFVNEFAHRIWYKGADHRKRSVAQVQRFADYKNHAKMGLSEFRSRDIIGFLDYLEVDCGLNIKSANRYAASLSSVFKYAVKLDEIDSIPHIPFKEEPEGRINTFNDRQLEDIVAYFVGRGKQWLADMVIVASNTGCRRGEILKIGTPSVHRDGNVMTVLGTKNGDDKQVVLNEPALEAVRRLETSMGDFTHRKFYREWGLARRDLKLGEGDVFHTLRHTFASNMTNKFGANAFIIAKMMGHKTLKTTQKYTHIDLSEQAKLVAQLAN